MHFPFRWGACCALVLTALSAPAHAGLLIVPSYDSTVTSRGDAASIETAFAYAAQQYSNLFSDNITLHINVVASSQAGLLGQSNYSLSGFSYSEVRSAMLADAKTASDSSANSHDLPASDPTGGGLFALTFPEQKALGLLPGNTAGTDGTFTFGTGNTYTYDPNNRAVAGAYDFIGVAEHEISEIMGRAAALNVGGFYEPYDLFRYKSSGPRSLSSADTNAYFSIDDGATNLKSFNSASPGDLGDWAGDTNDAYNAFGTTGVQQDISSVDMTAMDVLGYDLVPEPSSLAICGFMAVLLVRRKHRSVKEM
jgi:hypothetical protein